MFWENFQEYLVTRNRIIKQKEITNRPKKERALTQIGKNNVKEKSFNLGVKRIR